MSTAPAASPDRMQMEKVTVIAYSYRGQRLNRPNDAVVKSDGSIYFTDPGAPGPGLDLDNSGVYMVTPDLGEITMIVGDFLTPNGIAFSPDESILYVNDTRRQHIRAFDVQPNGTLALASDRVLCDLSGDRPGVPDGMKVDVEGNIYCGGSARCLGDRFPGQPFGNGRPRRGRNYKCCVRWRRLEDPLLHDLEHGRKCQREHTRHSRAD